ncbi:MAG TPA: hypothetical protein VF209_02305, partial [Patescibacteria group bacterium]
SRMIAGMMTQPPATTETYVADLLNSAGVPLAQPAYAQGFGGLGFNSLIPILEAWKTFRNLAYMFFVIIFLVIGFMIMFRQKIGSQTVVTAQQAIPQIIIALLTVTFSYAIAGLLIDVMYLFMALMIAVFDLSDQTYLNLNVFTLGGTMIKGGASVGYDAVDNFINNALGVEGGDAALDVLSDGAEIVGGFAAAVIIAIAITIQVFRLFIELLKTYVSIIISITLSPLLLMTEAIPGRHTFFPWVKSLVANLAAFPTILLLLIIFDKLTGGFTGTTPQIEDGGFSPPFLIGLGGPGAGVIPFLIGFGMLMIMPTLVQQVKKALGAGGGIFEQFGQAFGDSVKLGWKGGELIPGMAWTDTSRMPVIGSGKDFFRKTGIATSGVAGGAYGALWEAPRRRAQGQRDISRWTQLRSRADQFARKAGSSMSDPHIKEKKADEKKPHK